MADSKKLVKLLPDEYQELEYIQSGSLYFQTGYIDTGLVGTDLYGCEIETCMKVTVSTTSNLYYLNGAWVSGFTTQIGLIREDDRYVHSIANMGFNTVSYSDSIALNDWHTIYTSDGIQKTDGVIISNETDGTLNNLHYLLFARSDTGVTLSPPFAMKYFWVKKNGQYIRNMIPAKRKSDNVVGMYDIANDVFYTSENQYTFIGGGDVDYWQHSLRKLGTSTDTITTLPADLYADGNNATVGLVGNMQQTGTPTPDNPIQPSETGERTGNLIPFIYRNFNYEGYGCTIVCDEKQTFHASGTPTGAAGAQFIIKLKLPEFGLNVGDTITFGWVSSNPNLIGQFIAYNIDGEVVNSSQNNNYTSTISTSVDSISLIVKRANNGVPIDGTIKFYLFKSSTPLPYEPYGYKIPISSANTTTPVYLGEVETTRKIKKLVLTGEEDYTIEYDHNFLCSITTPDSLRSMTVVCSHIKSDHVGSPYNSDNAFISATGKLNLNIISLTHSVDGIKEWLRTEYANGTPVCVWYVLATETTGIVNEPLRKIGDYADTVSGITIPTITSKDTFDVLTTLKPSEVDLTYHGWHDASVKEKSRNLFDKSQTFGAGYYDDNGELHIQTGTNATEHTELIPTNGTTTFTIKGLWNYSTGVSAFAVYEWDSSKNWLRRSNRTVETNENTPITFNIGADTHYISLQVMTKSSGFTYDSTMLNTGSTALPYEPYWK